jgi:hypothetical protein
MKRTAFLLASVLSLFGASPALAHASQDAATDRRVAVLIERMLKADTEQTARRRSCIGLL